MNQETKMFEELPIVTESQDGKQKCVGFYKSEPQERGILARLRKLLETKSEIYV